MGKVSDAWVFEKSLPKWTSSVVSGLKRLDAADAVKGKQTLDGNYLGVDLKAFALRYAVRSKSEFVPIFVRLIEATEGLRSYSQHPSADALGRAMLEGARAMIDGQPPRYAAVQGFKSRFIDVDFAGMFNEIANGKPTPNNNWREYWQNWLGGCWPDLFVHRFPCDGCACEFPK